MDGESLIDQINRLRQEGRSIRAIAAQLGIYPSRVQRVLKSLSQRSEPSLNSLMEQWTLPPHRVGGVFVGRQQEMRKLREALEDALSGRGRLVMLAGEPGIGKTRTVQEFINYARTTGAQILWGWCYEEQGAPPYWPWVQTIRQVVRFCCKKGVALERGYWSLGLGSCTAPKNLDTK